MGVVAAAGIGSGLYKLLFLLHIVSIVAAFAPLFVHPLLYRQLQRDDRGARSTLVGSWAVNNRRIHAPALIVAGFLGILLVVASDSVWEFSQAWVSVAFLVWIAMNGVLHGLQIPAQRRLAGGDRAAASRLDLADGLMVVLFVLMLVLMIWKPGGP